MKINLAKYSSIIVYGLGKSGISCLKFLLKQGYENVFATDDNPDSIAFAKRVIEDEFACDRGSEIFIDPCAVAGKIDGNSRIVFAPGIPLYHPDRHAILDLVKDDDSRLICDLELFADIFADRSQVNRWIFNIGITGTNGKSTISSLIDYILAKSGLNSCLVGNIGNAIFDIGEKLLDLEEGGRDKLCLVTEASSFQLDLTKEAAFDVAAISNFSDDHIKRHGNFENYVKSKFRIAKNSSKDDFVVINYDDVLLKKSYEELSVSGNYKIVRTSVNETLEDSVCLVGEFLQISLFGFNLKYDVSNMIIRGSHNKENYLIAIACCLCYLRKVDVLTKDLIDRIVAQSLTFSGLRHRMQLLGVKNGVKFVNDSKGTNPNSTVFALNSYDDIFWIVGGDDKGADLDVLTEYLLKVKKAYVVGKSSERVEKFLKKNDVKYEICFNLELAFEKSFFDAKNFSCNNPVIMMSPACASFDQWRNFEERGDYFCKLFNEIK